MTTDVTAPSHLWHLILKTSSMAEPTENHTLLGLED